MKKPGKPSRHLAQQLMELKENFQLQHTYYTMLKRIIGNQKNY
jgi:hypothetical protein